MFHEAAIEHDSVGCKFRFKVRKPFLKSFRPCLKAQSFNPTSPAREMLFQAPSSCWVRPLSILQVRNQRSILVKGRTKPRANSQREHACRLPVTGTVLAFGHGHGIGVVDECKASIVVVLKARTNVTPNPSLAEVRGGDRPSILDGTGKTYADGAVPTDGLQRCPNGGKDELRFG